MPRGASRRYLTMGQVADAFGVDRKTVWQWVQEGKLTPSHRTVGGHYRFSVAYINSLLTQKLKDATKEGVSVICKACAEQDHEQCRGHTHCDCQHRTQPIVPDANVMTPANFNLYDDGPDCGSVQEPSGEALSIDEFPSKEVPQ